MLFRNRIDAGRQLAERLAHLRGSDAVVLGLPRGGVPVASEVADALDLPLDVIVVRKLGMPGHEEFAMGALGEGDVIVVDREVVAWARLTTSALDAVVQRERAALEARVAGLRAGRPRIDLTGRTAVIVDDGIATGSTAKAACEVARRLGAVHIVLAAPVLPAEVTTTLTGQDELVYVAAPKDFQAVGRFYRDFSATTDAEVLALLDAARG